MESDYLIVGSGLTGSVIARLLVDAGCSVLVVERRAHFGGNVHDQAHFSGIRIHTYGPHYFRTNSENIWKFVNRFSSFYKYEPELKSLVDGKYEAWPITADYINLVIGDNWKPEFRSKPTNFEEASLSMMPRLVYEKFVKGYTEKQWGVPARHLSASLAKRFDIREDDERRLVRHQYQGIPEMGYAGMMCRMLAGIPVVLNCDYLKYRKQFKARRKVIFTGPIDEYFGYDIGKLKYRGQQREHQYFPNIEYIQPCGQVNNPDPENGPYIRTLEWKHMMPRDYADRIQGTVITREVTVTPNQPDNYEYPFPDDKNAELYAAYRDRARRIPDLLICGRLGEYRYYDMDQAIARATMLAKRLLEDPNVQERELNYD
jgi:UDP-galactopyranose mutase